MENVSSNLGTENIKKLAFKVSIPMVLSMISISLYGIVDTMFVSRIGEEALTAVSLSSPFQYLITAIALGTGIGVNSILARTLGEKNDKKAKEIIQNGIILSTFSWLLILVVFVFATKMFLNPFTTNTKVLELGKEYLYILGIVSIGSIFQIYFEKVLEAYGRSKSSMIVQFSGAIINLLLDPILIFGYLGFPSLGIKGAAISSVIGQCVGMIIGLIFIIKYKILNFKEVFRINLNKEICYDIYKVGFPTTIFEGINSFITLILNRILVEYSENAVSVWGIYAQLQRFVLIIIYGFNYGMIPILAYNLGAKNKERIKEGIKVFIKIAIGITFIGEVAFTLCTKQLINIFEVTNEVLNLAIPAFRILSISFIFAGVNLVIAASFQAFGNGTFSLIVNLSRKIVFPLLFIFILKNIFGIIGVWMSFAIADILTMIVALILYKVNKKNWEEI